MMMALFFIFLITLELGLCSSSAVVELTDDNFSLKIAAAKVSLVMFYAPWCRHCQDFKPEFEQAALALFDSHRPVMLGKVDCMGNGKGTCKEIGISGYPTLHLYRSGTFNKNYDGLRSAEGIEDYMTLEAMPSPIQILSKEELENFLNSTQASVVGFFKKESFLKDNFMKLAEFLRKRVLFGITGSPENLVNYENKIVLFRPKHLQNKFEPDALVYDEDSNDDLESFILRHKHGLVGHRTKSNSDEFNNPLVVGYFNVDYNRNPKGTNYWRNRIMTVAKLFSDFNFAISAENEFPHELSEFGYEYDQSGDKPVVFARDKDNKKYKMKEEFSVLNFEMFLAHLLEGKIRPYIKSSPIPNNDGQPVKIAVAKNFDEIVTNNGKDTFIKFYAPWCIHCKDLKPVFELLGQEMAGEDVAIVKMDAVNNDIPSAYKVNGFPTLYWAPMHLKETPIKYEDGRSINDFIKFIAKHSTIELNRYDRDGNVKLNDEL